MALLPFSLIPAKEDAQSAFLPTLATQVHYSMPPLHLLLVPAPIPLLASAIAVPVISSAAECALKTVKQQQKQLLLLNHQCQLLLQQLYQLPLLPLLSL